MTKAEQGCMPRLGGYLLCNSHRGLSSNPDPTHPDGRLKGQIGFIRPD